MPRSARPAGAACALLLAFLWVSGVEVAVRSPDEYFLQERQRDVAVLLGWSAVLCAFLAIGLARGLLRGRRWTRLVVLVSAVCAAAVAWTVYADSRDAAYVNFGFVAGFGLERLLVVLAVGLAAPVVLAAAGLLLLDVRRRRA